MKRSKRISDIVKYMENYHIVLDDERLFYIAKTKDEKLKYGQNFLISLKKYQTEVPLEIRDFTKSFEGIRDEAITVMKDAGFKVDVYYFEPKENENKKYESDG